MSYEIEIEYHTGNSFGSHIEIENVPLSWNNLDIAKENLKRIKDIEFLFRIIGYPIKKKRNN